MSCSYYEFRQNDYYCNKKRDYVNSDVYYKYCRNNDYSDCPMYKNQDSYDSRCYITSACMAAKNLPDNCYELELLRHFRDTWLSSTENGKELIEKYYSMAPQIVASISEKASSKDIYERIYNEMISPCVKFIEEKHYEKARDLYEKESCRLYELFVVQPE